MEVGGLRALVFPVHAVVVLAPMAVVFAVWRRSRTHLTGPC